MPTGFDLTCEAARLVAELEEVDGVVDDQWERRFDALVEDSGDKLGAYKAVVDRLNTDADYLAREAKRYQARVAALRRQRDRVREMARALLVAHLELTGERKVKAVAYTAWLQSTTSLVGPSDPSDWPAAFVSSVPKIDKRSALDALKAGEEHDGISLAHGFAVRFR